MALWILVAVLAFVALCAVLGFHTVIKRLGQR